MSIDYEKAFNKLLTTMSDKKFLDKSGIGGESPTYIYAYEPADAQIISDMLSRLIKNLESKGISVLNIDLFDLVMSTIENYGILDWALTEENHFPKDEFLENIQGIASSQSLAPIIVDMMNKDHYDTVSISGVGKSYPIVRSHELLELLQKDIHMPLILFFPGTYMRSTNGWMSLKLFNRLPYENHYRAFNIMTEA